MDQGDAKAATGSVFEDKKPSAVGHTQAASLVPELNLTEAVRFHYFSDIFRQVRDLDGDIVECGVGWGRSLLYLALLTRIENKGRRLWGFDSFEGFPEPGEHDRSPRNPKKGEWKSDLLSVQSLLANSGLDEVFVRSQVTLVKGFFNESLPKYSGDQIALLHADADLYESYKSIYDSLFERVVPNGIIMFDEYMNTFEHAKWPGAKMAIDELFLERADLRRDPGSGKYYAIKRRC
ncbi:MAG: TylF/MycF/NovP-related O-methyltransferase [Vicinamibacterales bacterium]